MRILIAEDDPVLIDGLSRALKMAGYAVDCVTSGRDADLAVTTSTFDLLVLDLDLPYLGGLDVLKRLRNRDISLPVLIVTASSTVEQCVQGLDFGADDYLRKPFSIFELEARVRALLRRSQGNANVQIRCAELMYDQVGRSAHIREKKLALTARELGLLEVLLQRMGRLVSKDQIVEHLCGWGEEVTANAVEVYMHRLRKKLDGSNVRIATAHGLGYCLEKSPGDP